MFLVGIIVLVLLFFIGAPIWAALTAGGGFLLLFHSGKSTLSIPSQFFSSIDSFTLMAIPFFLIAGNIMAHCGPSEYIFNFINSWIGRRRGGLAFTTVAMSMVYAAITGSSTATLAGVSEIALPHLLNHGYSRKFCSGLLAVSCTIGQLIPPSVYMIIFGTLVQENAGVLFMAGIIPGLICGFSLGVVAIFLSPKKEITEEPIIDDARMYTWNNKFRTLLLGLPAVIMPLIVLGGIYSGIFTPTEAGAIAVAYGVLVSIIFYRTLNFKNAKKALIGSGIANSMVFMLIAGSMVFAQALTFEQIPQKISQIVLSSGLTGNALLLAITVLFMVLGCFLDPLPILFLVIPILLPALQEAGINLVHFNIITIVAMQIAQLTPPFGLVLYVTSGIVKVPIHDVLKASLPFMAVLLLILLLVIFVPELSLFLPRLMAR